MSLTLSDGRRLAWQEGQVDDASSPSLLLELDHPTDDRVPLTPEGPWLDPRSWRRDPWALVAAAIALDPEVRIDSTGLPERQDTARPEGAV